MKRVLICGPSGVGKSELANFIGLSLGVPFITTSTKPLWPAHDIKSHEELIKRGQDDPEWGLLFQYEVLKYRRDILLKQNFGYVCDRSPIDNLAYFMMQNAMIAGENETEKYRNICFNDLQEQADYIIRIKFKMNYDLKDDGMRVNNRYFQLMTDGVFESIFQADLFDLGKRFGPDRVLVIDTWDWNERIKMVQEFLDIDQKAINKWIRRNKQKLNKLRKR